MKTIGLACTGGGIKASSSLGVIKAFDEAGIKISALSGASIGSCIAVLYAIGYKTDEIFEKLKYYSVEYPRFNAMNKILALFNLIVRCGLKNPRIIEETIKEAVSLKGKANMNDIDIPVFIPSLDITVKETIYYASKEIKNEKCYTDRPIAEAVRSTCAFPFLFMPNNVYINGELHQFLDGGMTNNTPTTHMNEFVDIVIGIENIYRKKINHKKVNIITGIRNTFQAMRRTAVVHQRDDADIWLQVDCKDVGVIGGINKVEFCYKQGYEAAKKLIAENEILAELVTKQH